MRRVFPEVNPMRRVFPEVTLRLILRLILRFIPGIPADLSLFCYFLQLSAQNVHQGSTNSAQRQPPE